MTDLELIEYSLKEKLNCRKLLDNGLFPFGFEIEMERIDVKAAERMLYHKIDDTWKLKDDHSLILQPSLELATPVLTNDKETWNLLSKVSKTLKILVPSFRNASFQVNLDIISEKRLYDFLKFFSIYEDIIYFFSKGEDLHFRDSMSCYAQSISSKMQKLSKNLLPEDICNHFRQRKCYGISINLIHNGVTEGKEVIEFRTPNGTVDVWYWQNYLNTFYNMLRFIDSDKYDSEKTDYNFNHMNVSYELTPTFKIDIEKALEFANIIFDNDIDKLYFLKQYFKNHEEKAGIYIKSKRTII